jgi:hypothetical protein
MHAGGPIPSLTLVCQTILSACVRNPPIFPQDIRSERFALMRDMGSRCGIGQPNIGLSPLKTTYCAEMMEIEVLDEEWMVLEQGLM